jgi:acyl-CoA synthetase (NDP forming)
LDPMKPSFEALDRLFQPGSIALVGLPQSMKTGKLFLIALQDMGFAGPIYPVNPNAGMIDGLRCYPTVAAIDGPVDMAIILVTRRFAQEAVQQCAAKGVKTAVLFTAGFKETGTPEGLRIEAQMAATARAAGMRLLGPNCMGIYAPRTGLSFFPGLSRTPGHLSMISHSGSLANIICRLADTKGLAFNKVVSLGNEADLHSADFLAYFARDPDTTVIGGYIEGIKDGPAFLDALRTAAAAKPVVLWKVGFTPEGARAAASHTGALTGSGAVWQGVMRQCGATPVVGWDDWIGTLMAFYLLPPTAGRRVAIISGPGGLAVAAADAVGRMGLSLARLSQDTMHHLARHIPPTGTSLTNPVDVSLTALLDITIIAETAGLVAADPGVDAVLLIGSGLDEAGNRACLDAMLQAKNRSGKPFLIVAIPGMPPEIGATFCGAGIPFFDTTEQALAAYARVSTYYSRADAITTVRPPE